MTLEFVTRNWALVIASVLATAIGLFVLFRWYADSPRGRLGSRLRELHGCEQQAHKAARRRDQAAAGLAALQSRAGSVKPRLMSEAEEALQDAQMLQKIADDLVLVAKRRVRDVILEEFPPNRQDGLRNRHL
jgi:hypothetical protein